MIILTDKHKVPFTIDDSDYESVSRYRWSFHGYLKTNIRNLDPNYLHKSKSIPLHIFLLGYAPVGLEWDHRDRNTLNNVRSNLRLVTPSQNCLNRRAWAPSGHLGIQAQLGRYRAYITPSNSPTGKYIYVGTFDTIDEAVYAQRNLNESIFPSA